MTELARFDNIRAELALLAEPAEIKELRDKARGVELYARRQGMTELAAEAFVAGMWCERRIGEVLAGMDLSANPYSASKLEALFPGLSRGQRQKLSMRSQDFAAVPEEEFKRFLDGMRKSMTLAVTRLERLVREWAARDEGKDAAESHVPGTVDIRHVDFRELEIESNSIDLVFTDPPYPAEFLDLWYDLGEFAAKALRPSGMLVAYSGQFHLPEVIQALCSHLEYVWLGSLHTPGQHNQIMQRHVRSAAKPLLFFAAPPAEPGCWFDDAYVSEERKKDLHDWQQSPGAARYYIETLTDPAALVCDPFLGSGTTAFVAHELGRSFIGCDTDESAVATARARFA